MQKKIRVHEPYDCVHEVTIKELADANGLDYMEAQGFLKTLVKLGHCQMGKPRKVDGQKGKPTNVYLLPIYLELTVMEQQPAKRAA
ncbi:hypothetical protein [Nitrospira sp. BLG_2]|uniref:hypothetical protein n=1 Tax=Nitrospira sp. BLG_2 TaxID=3397507 RepID=UPI003B9D5ED2